MQIPNVEPPQLRLVHSYTEEKQEEAPENFLVSDRVDTPLSEPEMIFPGLWPARTIGLFTGDGGIGKTHMTLQILTAIASGGEIEGTPFQSPKPRPVVYISQEDEGDFILGDLLRQSPTLKREMGLSGRIRIISTALKGPNLTLSDAKSCKLIEDNLPDGGVFALDSWSTFLTSNENDNTELLQNELSILRRIIKARKATPLLIHHRPKRNPQTMFQASSRGGTALPNSCRFQIMIENRGEGVEISFEKVSRGAKPPKLPLVFDEERRLFVPSSADRFLDAFQVGEELTTSQIMERLGNDPADKGERKRIVGMLNYRKGSIRKVKDEKKGEDAVWKRTA